MDEKKFTGSGWQMTFLPSKMANNDSIRGHGLTGAPTTEIEAYTIFSWSAGQGNYGNVQTIIDKGNGERKPETGDRRK